MIGICTVELRKIRLVWEKIKSNLLFVKKKQQENAPSALKNR